MVNIHLYFPPPIFQVNKHSETFSASATSFNLALYMVHGFALCLEFDLSCFQGQSQLLDLWVTILTSSLGMLSEMVQAWKSSDGQKQRMYNLFVIYVSQLPQERR